MWGVSGVYVGCVASAANPGPICTAHLVARPGMCMPGVNIVDALTTICIRNSYPFLSTFSFHPAGLLRALLSGGHSQL